MVLGLFIITAIPTVTGVAQAVSAQKNREQQLKDEQRMKRFYIDIEYRGDDAKGTEVDNGRLVLKHDRILVGPKGVTKTGDFGYITQAFYVEYPDPERNPVVLGLASQVRDDPPLLNWLYVDKESMEVKYGNRTASIAHHVGAWDWCDEEDHVTLERRKRRQVQSFYVVKNSKLGRWQLYFDLNRDRLESCVPSTWIKLPVRLKRNLVLGGDP